MSPHRTATAGRGQAGAFPAAGILPGRLWDTAPTPWRRFILAVAVGLLLTSVWAGFAGYRVVGWTQEPGAGLWP